MSFAKTAIGAINIFKHLPIGVKLGATVVASASMIVGISLFGVSRLQAIGALQEAVGQQASVTRLMNYGTIAALDLRTISRGLAGQQTIVAVKRELEQAEKASASAADWLKQARSATKNPNELSLLGITLDQLARVDAGVRKEAALRIEMLTIRQKRLFQARPLFDTASNTFAQELASGDVLLGGADSVRSNGEKAVAHQGDEAVEAFNRYRLQMGRLQSAAIMFLATGNGSAANEVRDATDKAAIEMAKVREHAASDALRDSAKTVDNLGLAMSEAIAELIAQTKQLDAIATGDVEAGCQALLKSIGELSQLAARNDEAASEAATAAQADTVRELLWVVGGILVLLVLGGTYATRIIATPLRRMTRVLDAIAHGDTETQVHDTDRRDEIGRIARAVEEVRGTMRQAFVQAQMIEQLPIPVMTATANGDVPIAYANAEAGRMLELIAAHLPNGSTSIVGRSAGMFFRDPDGEIATLRDWTRLPYRKRIEIGGETLECSASAIRDRYGNYVGPMLAWHVLTAQTKLAKRFEDSVGSIASVVGESAEAMKIAAQTMTDSVRDTGQRVEAVADASRNASSHVGAVAAATEELAASVQEIGRQVAESAGIANQAVREAQETDRCVSGLSEAAERIGDVVRLIGDVAGRTNLLALNATIEAARAGEAGKGFAVVAGEVKNLAAQTAKATQEISAQIGGMQNSAGQAAEALREIGATIQRMSEIAKSIAEAVDQQSSATTEIARAVQQAAIGTQDVDSNISVVGEVSRSTGLQSASVLDAATRVSAQAVTLKDEVTGFLSSMREAA